VYRGPCIGVIYTHPSRVGGIHALFSPTLSNKEKASAFICIGYVFKDRAEQTERKKKEKKESL